MFNSITLYNSSKKYLQFSNFPGIWIFSKIQDGGHLGGHLGWRHGPPAAIQPIIFTLYCRVHHRLSIKGKIFSKYCNAAKTQGGFHPPPPPLHHGGVCISLYVRGLNESLGNKTPLTLFRPGGGGGLWRPYQTLKLNNFKAVKAITTKFSDFS